MFRDFLPQIPNLEVGYLYTFGKEIDEGRLTVDYSVQKTVLGRDVVFGETHARFKDLLKTLKGDRIPNVEFLIGGGYRKRVSDDLMVGVNGFYNSTRLYGNWYSSGIVGLEVAAVTPGEGIVTLSWNYYGNVFSGKGGIFSAFRYGPGDHKIDATYSQPLYDRALEVRLKACAYRFNRAGLVRGWSAGGDLSTTNGLLTITYEVGHDRISGLFHNAGLFVNVWLRLGNLMAGESPFVLPR